MAHDRQRSGLCDLHRARVSFGTSRRRLGPAHARRHGAVPEATRSGPWTELPEDSIMIETSRNACCCISDSERGGEG